MYQYKCTSPIYMYIRLSLEVTCTCSHTYLLSVEVFYFL